MANLLEKRRPLRRWRNVGLTAPRVRRDAQGGHHSRGQRSRPRAERAGPGVRALLSGHRLRAARGGNGDGLGLALVAEHVRLNHGNVWAEEAEAGAPGSSSSCACQRGLRAVRRRAAQPWLLAGTALAAVAALSGCGIPTQSSPQALPRDQVPGNLLSPTVPSVATTTTVPRPSCRCTLLALERQRLGRWWRNVTVPALDVRVINDSLPARRRRSGRRASPRRWGPTSSALGQRPSGVATVDFNLAFGLITASPRSRRSPSGLHGHRPDRRDECGL